MRINYLLATWFGPRRSDNRVGSHFLQNHLKLLNNLKQNLSQITIILPESDCNEKSLIEPIKNLKEINSVPVVLLQRENSGLSYGSWSHAYDVYRDQFDYYILIEDDYVFVQDNFDRILVDYIESVPFCGYLCAFYEDVVDRQKLFPGKRMPKHWKPHASVSNGIVKQEGFEAVRNIFGKIPYCSGDGYNCQSQIDFSAAFSATKFCLADFRNKYCCPYYSEFDQSFLDYGDSSKEKLIVPIQMVSSTN